MSIPVATYRCTSCDLSLWSSSIWGFRYYLYGESKVRMGVAMGWCNACEGLGAIEVLPDVDGERALQKKLKILQAELGETLAANSPRKRWWRRHARKSAKQADLEYSVQLAEKTLAEYLLARKALSSRVSRARCLRCGSEDCLCLPPHQANYSNTNTNTNSKSLPVPVGFQHPGCGGQLTVACEGTQVNMLLTGKAYDQEGHLVAETDSEPYVSAAEIMTALKTSNIKRSYNVDWLYKGMLSKRIEPRMVLAAAILFGAQLALCVYLLFR
jgi:hypothetical protein